MFNPRRYTGTRRERTERTEMLRKSLGCSIAVLLLAAGVLLAHGDYTHLIGTVTVVNGDHVSIKDTAGKSIMVMTHKDTKYLKDDKPVASGELKTGVRVVIDAKMDAAMKMYKADQIKIGVAAPVNSSKK
jgi:hypothetical protein